MARLYASSPEKARGSASRIHSRSPVSQSSGTRGARARSRKPWAAGAGELALIVADGNAEARAFYAAQGFRERARAPLVPEDWETGDREWILLALPLAFSGEEA